MCARRKTWRLDLGGKRTLFDTVEYPTASDVFVSLGHLYEENTFCTHVKTMAFESPARGRGTTILMIRRYVEPLDYRIRSTWFVRRLTR